MSGSSSTFPSFLFLFLFMSVSSLSIFALSAIVASPASVYHAVKFCLIPLTDVCLFQMPFSVKGQPQYSLQLPCSCHPPHLFSLFLSSFSSICITFELCLNPVTRFSLSHITKSVTLFLFQFLSVSHFISPPHLLLLPFLPFVSVFLCISPPSFCQVVKKCFPL